MPPPATFDVIHSTARAHPAIYLDQADAALGITGAKASRNPRQTQRTANAFRPFFLQPNSAPFPDDVATREGSCPPNPSFGGLAALGMALKQ